MLVNKTNSARTVKLSEDLRDAASQTVDEDTGDEAPRTGAAAGDELMLAPFAVTILTAKQF